MFDKTKERIAAVQAIPGQLKLTFAIAIGALVVALIAMSMTMVVGYRAN